LIQKGLILKKLSAEQLGQIIQQKKRAIRRNSRKKKMEEEVEVE